MEIYIVSVISTFLGYFSSILANRKPKGILPTIGILTILAITALVLTFLGHWAITPSTKREKDKVEGQWIEKYKEGEKPVYAIATIRYNSENRYLEFYGNSYDANLNLVGHWQTIQARLAGNQYDYLFEGNSINPDKTRQGHRKGVGSIWFDNSNHGVGHFFSVRADKELREFELIKILNEEAANESINNPQEFIKKLYENSNYLKQVTSAN